MTMFSKIDGIAKSIRSGLLSRILAALLGGSLNQKAILALGLAIMAYSLYFLLVNLWWPLIAGALGYIFVHLAVKDYERATGSASGE